LRDLNQHRQVILRYADEEWRIVPEAIRMFDRKHRRHL